MNKPSFACRIDTWDTGIYKTVYQNNEYKITPGEFNNKLVLDIGCHIGSFSRLVLDNNPDATVISVEAHGDNYNMSFFNLKEYSNVTLLNKAVWRSDKEPTTLYFSGYRLGNTGGGNVLYKEEGESVQTISLKEIIETLIPPDKNIALIKIDCEGAEFPIFYTLPDDCFNRIDSIKGEFHQTTYKGANCEDLPSFTITKLKEFLESKGFKVSFNFTSENLGHFYCTK